MGVSLWLHDRDRENGAALCRKQGLLFECFVVRSRRMQTDFYRRSADYLADSVTASILLPSGSNTNAA